MERRHDQAPFFPICVVHLYEGRPWTMVVKSAFSVCRPTHPPRTSALTIRTSDLSSLALYTSLLTTMLTDPREAW